MFSRKCFKEIYFVLDSDILPYKCNNSSFADLDNKHIVTGDLGIIKNNILKKLFYQRTRYREVRFMNFRKLTVTYGKS